MTRWRNVDCDSDCRFRHEEQMSPGAVKIDCSADDFTAVEPGQDFVVTVSYNRPIEGKSLMPSSAAGGTDADYEHP
jgi:hypothetical protein